MEVVFAPEPADRFDVVIKSSDDKLLHMHSTALMHHSKVFRAIEDLGASKVVILRVLSVVAAYLCLPSIAQCSHHS
jgi:hypothetical protein